jgi:hypothetical protein
MKFAQEFQGIASLACSCSMKMGPVRSLQMLTSGCLRKVGTFQKTAFFTVTAEISIHSYDAGFLQELSSIL